MPSSLQFITVPLILLASFGIFSRVRRDYRLYGRLTSFTALLQVAIFGLHGSSLYLFAPDWPVISASWLYNAFALLLGMTGLALTLLAMAGLGFRRAVGQDQNLLRQTGLYRWSRNPQIVSYGLVVLAAALLPLTGSTLLWLALYGAIAHQMVLVEEEHLRLKYGEAYTHYCTVIPRYLGWPARSERSEAPVRAVPSKNRSNRRSR